MKSYALIGHPLGHSVSPEIHSRLFALSGKSGCEYSLKPIAPEEFSEKFEELKALAGFNVTIPHKQTIIPYLHALDRSAARYGAVNTVAATPDGPVGCNTDVTGFLKSVEQLGVSFPGKKVLVLGYGGAGRMMAAEAVFRNAAEVTVAARRESLPKAAALVDELKRTARGCVVSALALDEVKGGYDLIVNSTPVGMYPKVGISPLSKEQLSRSKALFDAVYNPGVTQLMADAKECGLKTVGGMTMLVWQAAAAHEIWYGADFDPSDIEALIAEMEEYIVRHFR